MTTPLSIVVCSRDRPALLARTLASLARTGAVGPDDELVVVDSASCGRETGAVASAAGATVVRAESPGLSRARNVGIARSTRPVVAFTDDDCMIGPRWRSAIAAVFDDPVVGLATGPVVAHGDERAMRLSTTTRADDARFAAPARPGDIGHGANMAYRRAALVDAGPFDEVLGAGAPFRAGDDWDMFWRVLRAGWTAAYASDAVVHHEQWRTRREAVRTRFGYSIGAAAFCVKAARLGDPIGRTLLADRVRREGFGVVVRGVRERKLTLAAMGAANVAGCVAGAVRARARALGSGGCFRPTP